LSIHRSTPDKEIWKNSHLFFYLADEDGNALDMSTDALKNRDRTLLASGTKSDIGDWQLHLKSTVMSEFSLDANIFAAFTLYGRLFLLTKIMNDLRQ